MGFSAEDYNFRRILRQIGERKTDDRPHYLILSVGRWISDIYEEVCRIHAKQSGGRATEADAERISKDAVLLLRYILQCRAAYWKRFNIRPIWVTVKEIPQRLAELVPD